MLQLAITLDQGQLIKTNYVRYPQDYFQSTWFNYFCGCGCNKYVLEEDDFSDQIEFEEIPACNLCGRKVMPWDVFNSRGSKKKVIICYLHKRREDGRWQ